MGTRVSHLFCAPLLTQQHGREDPSSVFALWEFTEKNKQDQEEAPQERHQGRVAGGLLPQVTGVRPRLLLEFCLVQKLDKLDRTGGTVTE